MRRDAAGRDAVRGDVTLFAVCVGLALVALALPRTWTTALTATIRRKLHYAHPEQDAFTDDLELPASPAADRTLVATATTMSGNERQTDPRP